jgi:phthalate 4,5-dioxygenase oxygenase subunit
MGPIFDRSREHLGTTDRQIIVFRRIMLNAAKAFGERKELPPTVDDGALYRVRGTSCVLPKGADWVTITEPWRQAFGEGVPEEYRGRNAPAIAAAV